LVPSIKPKWKSLLSKLL